MKIAFHSYANKTNFQMKSFAFGLAFIMRVTTIRNDLLSPVIHKQSKSQFFPPKSGAFRKKDALREVLSLENNVFEFLLYKQASTYRKSKFG